MLYFIFNIFMPFTYCVSALRETISGVDYSVLFMDFIVLAAILVVSLAISILFKGNADKVQSIIQDKKNSVRFIEIYNKIDDFMRRTLEKENGYRHYNLIEDLAKVNKSFKKYEKDLKSFGDLRNAIVHNPELKNADPIAEPHEYIIQHLIPQSLKLCKKWLKKLILMFQL